MYCRQVKAGWETERKKTYLGPDFASHKINGQKKLQIRNLGHVVNLWINQQGQNVLDGENCLAERLNVPVFTLGASRQQTHKIDVIGQQLLVFLHKSKP